MSFEQITYKGEPVVRDEPRPPKMLYVCENEEERRRMQKEHPGEWFITQNTSGEWSDNADHETKL